MQGHGTPFFRPLIVSAKNDRHTEVFFGLRESIYHNYQDLSYLDQYRLNVWPLTLLRYYMIGIYKILFLLQPAFGIGNLFY
jgi:hypothetical protein